MTESYKKIFWGAAGMSDFTIHKNGERIQQFIDRHKNNENWSKSGRDTAGLWSLKYLWSYPAKNEAYNHIKRI